MGFDAAFDLVNEWVDAGRIPGAVLGVIDRDEASARLHPSAETAGNTHGLGAGMRSRETEAPDPTLRAVGLAQPTLRAVGLAQRVPVGRSMTAGTWFDLASLTKVIFTTPRILDAAVAGILDLDAPITQVLPELRQSDLDAWQRRITPRDCLTHASGLPATWPVYTYGTDPDQLRAFVIQRDWPHGDPVYSDLNYMLLGFVLERLADARIRELDPGEGFAWSADPAEAAATEYCPWRRRMLVGTVHDENAAALQGAGHAGLFGTAASVLGFARRLLDGSGAAPEAIELMRTPVGPRRTYGWEHPYEGWSGGDACSPATIGHTGFTGTGLWIDFDAGRAWTLLTNRVHPSRWSDSGVIELRRLVAEALYA